MFASLLRSIRCGVALAFVLTCADCGARTGLAEPGNSMPSDASSPDAALPDVLPDKTGDSQTPDAVLDAPTEDAGEESSCLGEGSACYASEQCCMGACSAGACTTAAPVCLPGDLPTMLTSSSTGGIVSVAIDAEDVYYLTSGGQVGKVAKKGGSGLTLVAGGALSGGLAIDATHAYWTTSAGVSRVAKTGGAAESIASDPGAHSGRVQVDEANAYWTNQAGTLRRVSKSGGATALLASDLAWVQPVSLDHQFVYVGVQGDQRILRVPKAGGLLETLTGSPDDHNVYDLAVDSKAVYYTEATVGRVRRLDLDTKESSNLASFKTALQKPLQLALEATDAYVAVREETQGGVSGSVYKVSKQGGEVVQVAAGLLIAPTAIGVDSACLFLGVGVDLLRVAK